MPTEDLSSQINSFGTNKDFFNSEVGVSLVHGVTVIVILIAGFLIFRKPLSELIAKLKDFFIKTKNNQVSFTTHASQTLETDKSIIRPEASAPEDSQINEESKPRWENPQTLEDWRISMFIYFWDKDFEKAEKAYEKINQMEKNSKQRKLDKIEYYQLRYSYMGDSGAIQNLKIMAEDKEVAGNARKAIGLCHESAESFSDAASEFLEASKLFQTDEERIEAKIYASKNILKTKNSEDASKLLTDELKKGIDKNLEIKIYSALAELFESKDDQEIKVALLERALKNDPTDKSLLFKAGYASFELSENFNGLSLLHYKSSIKFGSKDETVFNNIGVQYQRLNMPIKSVSFYKESIEKGGTLAAANLAYKYMNAGFIENAKEVLDATKDKDNIHKNISEAVVSITENIEEEDKKEKDTLEEAEKQKKFLANFAESYFTPIELKDFSGTWESFDGVKILIEQNENLKVVGTWLADGKKMKFEGHLHNSGIIVKNFKMFYTGRLNRLEDELGFFEEGKSFIFFEDQKCMKIMNMNNNKTTISLYSKK